jgi:hypothetical protein
MALQSLPVASRQMVNHVCGHIAGDKHAQRNLLCVSVVRELAVSKAVKPLIDSQGRLLRACLWKQAESA